jgi:hypothetical protein
MILLFSIILDLELSLYCFSFLSRVLVREEKKIRREGGAGVRV